MKIEIALEGKYENKYIVWALNYPGCFGYGIDKQEAIIQFPNDFLAYQNWINFKAGVQSWLSDIKDFDIHLTESFSNYFIDLDGKKSADGGKIVCSWFQQDGVPLNQIEVDQAIQILAWSRKDLLDLWQLIPAIVKEQHFEGERWTITEIFSHVANAEWWYLDRLGLANCIKSELPDEPLERLSRVRENLLAVLPKLVNTECVLEIEGEIWSPRKMIRRTCWHDKDHLVHIQKLINRY